MWKVSNDNISVSRGDFGIGLQFSVAGVPVQSGDSLRVVIKQCVGGPVLISKEFTDISGGSFEMSFTEEEAQNLKPGNYVWRLDWFKSGVFQDCLVENAAFKVVMRA
ncbi:MAG: hypothetical protein ACSW8H_06535 [bacterium]